MTKEIKTMPHSNQNPQNHSLKQLGNALQNGTITRRHFVEAAIGLGIAAAAAPLYAEQALADTPRKGGHLKIGTASGSTTDNHDPGLFADTFMAITGVALNGYLMVTSVDGNPMPSLAESIEASPDAKIWTVKLRRNVEFHNGKTVTVDDVIDSINHHRKKDTTSKATGVVEPIADIKPDGKDHIVFTLKGGNADFPFTLADYHLAILPSRGGIDPFSGVGAGPYQVEDFEPGLKMTMSKYANYWDPDYGHVDSAEALVLRDVSARIDAVASGLVDVIDRPDLRTIHLLKRNRNLDIIATTGTQHYSMPMITNHAPFDNNDLRLALKYAIDREALVKTILRGYGQPANDHPIGPSNRFYNNELPQRQYDVDKARYHLKRAGYDRIDLDLSSSEAAFPGAIDAATLYREYAAKAGININIIRETSDGYWSNVWMKKPWTMCYWSGRVTEDQMFSIAYASGANWNDTFWDNKRFNQLLVDARAELNTAKRRELYYEMQAIVRDQGGVVIPMYADYVNVYRDNIGHGKIAGDFDMNGLHVISRSWLKA